MISSKIIKRIPIDGMKVTLIADGEGGYYLRLYDKNSTEGFYDATIFHNDLELTLHGEGIFVIGENDECYVDHSDAVLGYNNKQIGE